MKPRQPVKRKAREWWVVVHGSGGAGHYLWHTKVAAQVYAKDCVVGTTVVHVREVLRGKR